MMDALQTAGSYGRGNHPSDILALRCVEHTREVLAELLGSAHPDRICFTHNATEALNAAIMSLGGLWDPASKDTAGNKSVKSRHIVTTEWEHNSVLRPLVRLEELTQARISYIPANPDGSLAYDYLNTLDAPDLVVATHASNVTGEALDVDRLVSWAHAHGAPFILDVAQSAGCIPISFDAWDIDVMCGTGHKALLGPQGTGFMLISPRLQLHPWLVGGSGIDSLNPHMPAHMPDGCEAGTRNTPGIAGLGAGITWLLDHGLPTLHEQEQNLVASLIARLRDLACVRMVGPAGRGELPQTPVVSFVMSGKDTGALADTLATHYDIATRAGLHCAPRMHKALGALDTGLLRVSLGALSTQAEIDALCDALSEIAQEEIGCSHIGCSHHANN